MNPHGLMTLPKKPRVRKTRPGDVIRDANELMNALSERPSIYWRGKCQSSSFVWGMQFGYLMHQMAAGLIRHSVPCTQEDYES